VDSMSDNHTQLAPGDAIELCRAMEPFGLVFFKEPVPLDTPGALAKVVAARVPVRLATSERLFTKWGYWPGFTRDLVDVAQPDVCHAGGISELRKIAAQAKGAM